MQGSKRAPLGALGDRLSLLQKSDFVAQFRIVRLDTGEIRWIEVRSLITYGNDRRPLYMTGASIDVADSHMRGLMDCEIKINPFFTIAVHRRRKS
jgi:hypothetical protein